MKNKYGNLEKLDRKKDTITMEEFVNQYLNENGAIDCKKLKHKELKFLGQSNPCIVSLSFDYSDANPELVANGKVLIVIDGRGNPAPYLNPQEIIKLKQHHQFTEELKQLKKETIRDLQLLSMRYFKMIVLLKKIKDINTVNQILEDNRRSYVIRQLTEPKM